MTLLSLPRQLKVSRNQFMTVALSKLYLRQNRNPEQVQLEGVKQPYKVNSELLND